MQTLTLQNPTPHLRWPATCAGTSPWWGSPRWRPPWRWRRRRRQTGRCGCCPAPGRMASPHRYCRRTGRNLEGNGGTQPQPQPSWVPPSPQRPAACHRQRAHVSPEEFLHLMDMGVVGDFVGEVSASASSLWLGSVSDSSRTDTSEPGEQGALTASTARCGPALAAPHFPTARALPQSCSPDITRRQCDPSRSQPGHRLPFLRGLTLLA